MAVETMPEERVEGRRATVAEGLAGTAGEAFADGFVSFDPSDVVGRASGTTTPGSKNLSSCAELIPISYVYS